MAKHWYMYANNEFIGHANGCRTKICNCPAIDYAESVNIRTVYEPLVNRGINILFKPENDETALANKILKICNGCIYGNVSNKQQKSI